MLALDPRLSEVAVLGVPDAKWGELVAAVVVARPEVVLPPPDALLTELARHCDQHLADFKRPRLLRVVPALPRNAMGKVMKASLRTLFES